MERTTYREIARQTDNLISRIDQAIARMETLTARLTEQVDEETDD